jgi:thiol:disulfide interchange protein DsbD
MRWIAVQLAFVTSVCAAFSSRAALPSELVQAQLLTDVSSVKPGEPFTVGVLLKLAPHYHVYWVNPGDSGQATSIKIKASPLSKIEPMPFPTPIRIDLPGGLVNYGYESEVMFLTKVTPPANPKLDTTKMELSADVSWLVCSESECIPSDAKITLSLPITGAATADNATLFKAWRDRIPTPVKGDAQASAPPSDLKIEITSPEMRDGSASRIEWFPGNNDPLMIKDIKVTPSAGNVRVSARLELPARQKMTGNTIESVLGYTDSHGQRRGLSLSVPIATTASADKGTRQ